MRLRIWLADWPFFLALLLLMAAGLLNQMSAGGPSLFVRQAVWSILGLGIFVLFWFWDYRRLLTFQRLWGVYGVLLLLLLGMALKHQRWLYLGGFSLQPSEFTKPLIVCLLAVIFAENPGPVLPAKYLFLALILALGPAILIAVSDLDQAFLLLVIAASMIFLAGLPRRILVGGAILGLAMGLVIGPLVWKQLKPYQKARLEAFFKPGKTQKRWSYQTEQALIAVGSGGLAGQGFKRGLSSKLHYLPAKHTDLAFAVWAEEWGFLGATPVILLFMLLIGWLLRAAYLARDCLGRFLAFGSAAILFWEVFFNLGGVLHLLPAASLPLPFLSYGGSAMFANMIMLGIAASVMRRRFSFL